MRMDTSIPLQIQGPDIMGAMDRDTQAATNYNALRQQNALADIYRTQGAGIMAGDPTALNALAGMDPAAALGIQNTRQGMQADRQRMDMLSREEQRQIAAHAANMSAAERAAAAAELEGAVKFGLALPNAAAWDAEMSKSAPDLVGKFDNRFAEANRYTSMADIIKGRQSADPMKAEMDILDLEKRRIEVDNLKNPKPDPIDPKDIDDLRKQWEGLGPVKSFAIQSEAASRIGAAAQDPSAAGDLALIFSYMKMLDPGSVVREGEFANAQNATGVEGRVIALYNNLLNGQRLTPETRADFLKRADMIYSAAEKAYSGLESQYSDIATSRRFDPNEVVTDFRYQREAVPPASPPPAPAPQPSAPSGRSSPMDIDGYKVEALD